jgi:hypothetical protein
MTYMKKLPKLLPRNRDWEAYGKQGGMAGGWRWPGGRQAIMETAAAAASVDKYPAEKGRQANGAELAQVGMIKKQWFAVQGYVAPIRMTEKLGNINNFR